MKGQRSKVGAELVPLALILGTVLGSLGLVVAVQRPKAAPKPPKAVPAVVLAVAPRPAPAPAAVPKPAPEPIEPEPPAEAAPVDPTVAAVAKLTSAEADQLLEASRADRKVVALEEARKGAVAESERWRRRESLVHAQLDTLDGKVRKMESELDELALERDALERERDSRKALAAKARSRPSQAILPHRGPNGTWRRPIVVECVNGMAVLQPGSEGFGLLDLATGFGPSTNPFVAAVAREAIRIQGQASPDGQPVVPYIFFVVRPDGIRPYYEARGRLEPLGITFGYELADQEWEIDFPNLDDPSTWDGSAPRGLKAAAREPAEDPLERVLHPKGNRGPAPKAVVSAEDQEFPSFGPTAPGRRGQGPAQAQAQAQGDDFAWPAAPRYIREAGIAGGDSIRPAGSRVAPAPTPGGGTGAAPAAPKSDGDGPGGRPGPSRPLDRQGRAVLARGDGASGREVVDRLLAGGPPRASGPDSRRPGLDDDASGDAPAGGQPGTPRSLGGPGLAGGPRAPGGAKGGLGVDPSVVGARGRSTAPASPSGGDGPPDGPAPGSVAAPPSTSRGGAILAADPGEDPSTPPDALDGGSEAGGDRDAARGDRPKADPTDAGSGFVWPRPPSGDLQGQGSGRIATDPVDPGAGEPDPRGARATAAGEDLGEIGADSPAGGGPGSAGVAQAQGQARAASRGPGQGTSQGRAGRAGSGASDPARAMLGSPGSASASGSPPQGPQGLAGLGLGLPAGMSPPPGMPGSERPPPAPSPARSNAAAPPDLPQGRMVDRTFEVVIVCGPRGVIVQPGGYRVTADALKDQDGLLKKQIVALVKTRRLADPGLVVEPRVRFLVQPGGAASYRAARGQFLLSGLDWASTTQVTEPDPLSILPSEGW